MGLPFGNAAFNPSSKGLHKLKLFIFLIIPRIGTIPGFFIGFRINFNNSCCLDPIALLVVSKSPLEKTFSLVISTVTSPVIGSSNSSAISTCSFLLNFLRLSCFSFSKSFRSLVISLDPGPKVRELIGSTKVSKNLLIVVFADLAVFNTTFPAIIV